MTPFHVALPVLLLPLAFAPSAQAWETWCGKHYELGAPRTPPDPASFFVHPPLGEQKLLDFRCVTASSIYLVGDEVHDPPGMVFDAELSYDVGEPVLGSAGDDLHVQVSLDTTPLFSTTLQIGSNGTFHPFPLPLSHLMPRLEPFMLTCTASFGEQTYKQTVELHYLPPNPYGGSSVKLDRRSGALWVQGASAISDEGVGVGVGKGGWEEMIPFGWYDAIDVDEKPSPDTDTVINTNQSLFSWPSRTQIDDMYQAPVHPDDKPRTNFERLELAHKLGFNMIHPVPPSTSYARAGDGDSSAIDAYFERAEELGIRVMYDMRHSFEDPSLVAQQVLDFRSRPNLLLWYTADEPDGPGSPLHSTSDALRTIRKHDPYHPVALVLNCYDHNFAPYVAGTDILLLDVYSIAMNPIYSKKWGTMVDSDFGCSGCDSCQGSFADLPRRIEEWRKRARALGRRRTLPMWVVPQAFDDHGDEFWWRVPEGREGAAQIVLGFNHGVMGHCAWLASSATPDLLSNASFIARHLYAQSRFIIDAAQTRRMVGTTYPHDGENGIDVAAWTIHHPSRSRSRSQQSSQSSRTGTHLWPASHPTEFEFGQPSLFDQLDQKAFRTTNTNDPSGAVADADRPRGQSRKGRKPKPRTETLVMAVQTNYGPHNSYPFRLKDVKGRVKEVLFGDVGVGGEGEAVFDMGKVSVAAVILENLEEQEEEEGFAIGLDAGRGLGAGVFSG